MIRKHTIDVDHWHKMKEGMNKEQIAELFSAPAGDYAPGTSYLTRKWGWCRGENSPVHETLEWQSEEGRIVVDFDEKGNFVFSEFYRPGRDSATNIAERVKWDRDKFAKVKKYVEERLGPIPVADIGFDWPNPWTSRAVCFELLWIAATAEPCPPAQ